MKITDMDWELETASIAHKQALFDYAASKGVQESDPGALALLDRNDEDLWIGWGGGLMSYDGRSVEHKITESDFHRLCDEYAQAST